MCASIRSEPVRLQKGWPAILLLLLMIAFGTMLTIAPSARAQSSRPLTTDFTLRPAMRAGVDGPELIRSSVHQQATGTCTDAIEEGQRLAQEPIELTVAGASSTTYLCLILIQPEEVYQASLVPIDSVERFRA